MKPHSNTILYITVLCFPVVLYSQWTLLGGPREVSATRLISLDTAIIITTEGEGVFFTNHTVASWRSLWPELPYAINSIVELHEENSGISKICATDRGIFSLSKDSTRWKISSSGLVQIPPQYGSGYEGISTLCAHDPSHTGHKTLFAGSSHGIYRSDDLGVTWVLNGLENRIVSNIISLDSILLSTTSYECFISADNGRSWISKSTGLSGVLSTIARDDSVVIVTTSAGLFKTNVRTFNWKQIAVDLQTKVFKSIVIGPADYEHAIPHYYLGTNYGMYVSHDAGENWKEYGSEYLRDEIRSILIERENPVDSTYLYSCTEIGIIRTEINSGLSQFQNDGFPFARITGMTSYTRDTVQKKVSIIVSTEHGVYQTHDFGSHWQLTKTGLPSGGAWKFAWTTDDVGNRHLFTITHNRIYKSTDDGFNWSASCTGLPNNLFCLFSSGKYLFTGNWDGSGVLRSTDNGLTWEKTSLASGNIYCITGNTDKLYAGTYINGLYSSTDRGVTWERPDRGVFSDYTNILSVGQIGKTVLAASDMSLFRSTNGGDNWGWFNNLKLNTITVDTVTGKMIAGDESGNVVTSSDSGKSWKTEDFLKTYNPSIMFTDAFVFIGTREKAGVWYKPISLIASVNTNAGLLPLEYSISQNYPNPFNPTTNIDYEIPHASPVMLTVYDMLGRVVTQLVNEQKNAGRYAISWDASPFSAGVYFARMQAGNYTATRKLVLVK